MTSHGRSGPDPIATACEPGREPTGNGVPGVRAAEPLTETRLQDGGGSGAAAGTAQPAGQSMGGRLVRVFPALSLARLARYAASPISAKVNSHFLGAFGVGVMSQLQTLVGQSSVLALHTVAEGTVKLIGEAHADDDPAELRHAREIAGTAFSYATLLATALCLGACVFSRLLARVVFGDPSLSLLVILTAVSFPLTVAAEMLATILRGLMCFRSLSISVGLSSVLGLGFAVPLVIAFGLKGACIALVTNGATVLLLNLGLALREPAFRRLGVSSLVMLRWRVVRTLGSYVAATVVAGAFGPVLIVAARAIMVRNVGLDGLGVYAPAIVFGGLLTEIIRTPISTILLPVLARQASMTSMSEAINQGLRFACICVLCVGGGLLAVRHFVVLAIYNRAFLAVTAVMGAHIIGMGFDVLAGTVGQLYFALPRLKALVVMDVLVKVSFLVLAFVGGPMGLWGVALAYLGMYVTAFTLTGTYFRLRSGFRFSRSFVQTGAFVLATLGFLSIVPVGSPIGALVAAAVTVVVAWLLTTTEEQRALVGLAAKFMRLGGPGGALP